MGGLMYVPGAVWVLLLQCFLLQAAQWNVKHTSSGHVIINNGSTDFQLCNNGDWFSVLEAEVVCDWSSESVWRMVHVNKSDFLPGLPIYKYTFHCHGGEARLTDCSQTRLLTHVTNCQAFRLDCDASARLSHGSKGRLIVRHSHGSEFLPSVTLFNGHAMVPDNICNTLGFHGVRTLKADARSFSVSQMPTVHVKNILCRRIVSAGVMREVCVVVYPYTGPYAYSPVSSERHLGIACVSEIEYRLAALPSTRRGRLEIRFGNSTSWHPVCYSGFSEVDGLIACRDLGFRALDRKSSFRFLPGYLLTSENPHPFILESPSCYGNESSLDRCNGYRQTWFPSNCHEELGIQCNNGFYVATYKLVQGDRVSGILSALYTDLTWYARWDDNFRKATAIVACRSMGLPHVSVLISRRDSDAEFGIPVKPVTIVCSGHETSLNDCDITWGHDQRMHIYIVHIECRDTELVEQRIRLDDTLSDFAGRVQMVNNGQWADVCLTHITPDVANVFCKQLGNQQGIHASQAHVLPLTLFRQDVRHTIVLNHFSCSSNAQSLQQCSWKSTFEYCPGTRLAVSCVPPDLRETEFRLTGGRLQVRQYGLWGAVCASTRGVDNLDIQICLDKSIVHTSDTMVNQLAWMHIESCSGQDGILTQQCSYQNLASRSCSMGSQDIAVRCDISSYIDDVPMRLVGGETMFEGRVEIKLRGRWGGICTTDRPTEELAGTICVNLQMSSSGAEIRSSIAFGGELSSVIHLSNVQCRMFTHSFSRCDMQLSTRNTCPAWNTLAVSCMSLDGSRPKTNLAVIIGSVCGVGLLMGVVTLTACIICRRKLPGGMPLQPRMTTQAGEDNDHAYTNDGAHPPVRHGNTHADDPPDYFLTVHYQNRGGDVFDMNFGSHGSRTADETRGNEELPPKYEDLFPMEPVERQADPIINSADVIGDGGNAPSRREPSRRPTFV